MAKKKQDPRVDKRRVTLTKVGESFTYEQRDYVGADYLDAYLDAARAADPNTGEPKWDKVEVSDEPDAGPGGYHGETNIPAELNHPEAGTCRPATKED